MRSGFRHPAVRPVLAASFTDGPHRPVQSLLPQVSRELGRCGDGERRLESGTSCGLLSSCSLQGRKSHPARQSHLSFKRHAGSYGYQSLMSLVLSHLKIQIGSSCSVLSCGSENRETNLCVWQSSQRCWSEVAYRIPFLDVSVRGSLCIGGEWRDLSYEARISGAQVLCKLDLP